MINNLNDVLRVLQIMWPRLGHKLYKPYKKGSYSYSITNYIGRSIQVPSGTKSLRISKTINDYGLEILFSLSQSGNIQSVSAVILDRYERLIVKFCFDQEITDFRITTILQDFGKEFLPIELWKKINHIPTVAAEERKNDFFQLVEALVVGKIVSLEENLVTGGICLAGIFDNDSDVVLHYSAVNLEKWHTQKDRKIILIKDLHELHL